LHDLLKNLFIALPGMERLIEMQHTIPHNLIYSLCRSRRRSYGPKWLFRPFANQETALWAETCESFLCGFKKSDAG
jgi:hypothetical protein